MNKYKKLILSLTTALLSSAGVWAMGQKPIPQIKTFREFGQFVNQHSPSDFLANKDMFGANKEGLLEVLLNSYNNLPAGTKNLAENLLQSKFKLSAKQLADKLAALDIIKEIPVNIAQAQAIIRREKSAFQNLSNNFTAKIDKLKSKITAFRGNIDDLEVIREDYDESDFELLDLQNLVGNLTNERDNLKRTIEYLKSKGVPTDQLNSLKAQLDDANAEIVKYKAAETKFIDDRAQLNAKIVALEAKITSLPPKTQAKILSAEYTDLAKKLEDFVNDELPNIVIPNAAKIQSMKDEDAATDALDELVGNKQLIADAKSELTDIIAHFQNKFDDLKLGNATPEAQKFATAKSLTDAPSKKINDKLDDINSAIPLIEKRLAAIAKAKGGKEVDDLIARYEEFGDKLKKFDAENGQITIFTNPNTTIESLLYNSKPQDVIKSIKNTEELTGADKKIKNYRDAALEFLANIEKEVASLNAEPLPAKIDPTDEDAIAAVKEAATENVTAVRVFLNDIITLLINAITKQIEDLQPNPKSPEEQLVEEIDIWIGTVKALKGKLTTDLKEGKDVNLEGLTNDLIKKELAASDKILKQYSPYLAQFQALEAKAKAFPAAEAKLNTDPLVNTLKELVQKADANVKAAEAKIAGGTPPPADDKVSDVVVDMSNYSLRFKIGSVEFKAEAGNDLDNEEFLDQLKNINVTDKALTEAGKEIAKKVKQAELVGIWGSIIDGVYEKATTLDEKDKIKAFIKPLFAVYKFAATGNDKAGAYKSGLDVYELENSDIKKELAS